MKNTIKTLLLSAALVCGSASASCVPLYSANVIEADSGRAMQVFVHARSTAAARQQLEASYGRGRVLRLRQETYC